MAATERRFRVMASDTHVIVTGAPAGAIDRARQLLEHLEQRWSRFLPDSDIAHVNVAGGRAVVVDPTTITLMATMVEAWRVTESRFDPTVLPVLVVDGYRCSIEDPTHVTVLPATPLRLGGVGSIAIDGDLMTVTAPPGVVVDPGGIGKGLAADLAVADLLAAGADGALVDIGGDLACAGMPPTDDGWAVVVEQPDRPTADLCALTVSAGGVATSSTRSRRWTRNGFAHHHVIDPAAGAQSTTDLDAVTVVAGCGWLAEAHATAAILTGSRQVIDYLNTHGVSGIAVTRAGAVITTEDLQVVVPFDEACRS